MQSEPQAISLVEAASLALAELKDVQAKRAYTQGVPSAIEALSFSLANTNDKEHKDAC